MVPAGRLGFPILADRLQGSASISQRVVRYEPAAGASVVAVVGTGTW